MLLTFEPAEDGSQDVEAAMELVSATAWDGPLEGVRQARAQVFSCFGLPEPVAVVARPQSAQPAADAGASKPGGAAVDENASYQALLTHTLRGM